MGEECSAVLAAWASDSECLVHKRRLGVCWMAKEAELKALRERLGEAKALVRRFTEEAVLEVNGDYLIRSRSAIWEDAEALLAGKGGKA